MLQQQGNSSVPSAIAINSVLWEIEVLYVIMQRLILVLHAACQRVGLSMFHNPCIDTLTLARRKIFDVVDYKLNTIAKLFFFGYFKSSQGAGRLLLNLWDL